MEHPNLKYVVGDATYPQGEGKKIIVHCCNDLGIWGAGFVLALSRRFPGVEVAYRDLLPAAKEKGYDKIPPGTVQFVKVNEDLMVANLVGQEGVGRKLDGTPPISYHAIHTGLARVHGVAQVTDSSVHMPRMGAGLAGGDWNRIEQIVIEELCRGGTSVTVYDLPMN